jgi:hypothetical protein
MTDVAHVVMSRCAESHDADGAPSRLLRARDLRHPGRSPRLDVPASPPRRIERHGDPIVLSMGTMGLLLFSSASRAAQGRPLVFQRGGVRADARPAVSEAGSAERSALRGGVSFAIRTAGSTSGTSGWPR